MAWLRLVAGARRGCGPYGNADAMLEAHPRLLSKTLLRLFYRRATVVSEEAKRRFVAADLAQPPSGVD